jgi:D-alanyl-D-alanine carboxypeptidase/D-alanyl-D-alanine-endopeptidase (penicillin-binding protein 4)
MTVGGVIAAGALLASASAVPAASAATTHRPAAGAARVSRTITRIEHLSRYRQSDWGYEIRDQRTGQILAAQNSQKLFDPGSTMKIYSVSAALSAYGPDYRFRTPVYRQGTVTDGQLNGNLVLVGSGDLCLGLRQRRNGTLYYENLPKIDHSYADQLPGAVEPPGNPLAALDQMARQVRASGITRVDGNIVVDDRLFASHAFPDGLVSPIWLNENLIDLLVKPTRVGRRARIDWRPMTASYRVVNRVRTVHGRGVPVLRVAEPTPGMLVVSGRIPVRYGPALRVWGVDHPSAFARTAFIEALQRAGVTVTAAPTGANPVSLLPRRGSYRVGDRVAQHVSVRLSQYAKLILKVSYNRAADLMTCLAAVRAGSRDCQAGLTAEVKLARRLGVGPTGLYPFDGAGSDDQGRSTPDALTTFLGRATGTRFGSTLFRALPILGRDGTLATVEPKSPAAGHAQVKTGNRVAGPSAGRNLVLGNSLAGYAQTRSGRHVTFMVAVGNVPIRTFEAFEKVTADQARMVVAIQQDL